MAAPRKKPRVFVDANVLFAGSAFPRWPYEVLRHAAAGDLQLVPDPKLEEIEAHTNLVRDASDVAVALAAIAADVDYVVSEDKDLTAHDETTVELRRHLQVMLSGTFLREVMGWASANLDIVRRRTWNDLPEQKTAEARRE
jgi:hypothetical protein